MEIQELKKQVEHWPRNKRGRLKLSTEDKSLIASVFRLSGLTVRDFCEASGLKESTVSKIVGAKLKKPQVYRARVRASVHSVQITRESAWSVTGPQGLKVECKTVAQVTELWRSLC